jgi:hypothetical protein
MLSADGLNPKMRFLDEHELMARTANGGLNKVAGNPDAVLGNLASAVVSQ